MGYRDEGAEGRGCVSFQRLRKGTSNDVLPKAIKRAVGINLQDIHTPCNDVYVSGSLVGNLAKAPIFSGLRVIVGIDLEESYWDTLGV